MKKNISLNIVNVISLTALSLAGGISAMFFSSRRDIKEAKAYSTSSLPTTIDLNDSSESDIRAYYSSLDSLSEEERKGNNLLKNLKTILKNGQKYYSYDTGKNIWKIYESADRDWVKSPASEISGYNSETNTITGYSYGDSETNPGTNPYIHALYVNRSVDNNVRAWARTGTTTTSHGGNNEWCIDREHIWPKAEGFETEAKGGARGDPMHLWPGDSDVNSAEHSNYYYGFVDSVTKTGKWSYATENLMGNSKTLGGSTKVFEPQDSDKGDIARAIFYMVARYNYLSGSDSDGIDSNNPNLALTQSLSDWANEGYVSTTTQTGKMGILTDLLEWHHLDPVDEFEIHRNNLLYKNFTNNRNPFIDFPEWVDYIWGTAIYNGKSYQSYDPTPTGYADTTEDVINGYQADLKPIVKVEITTMPTKTSYNIGDKFDPSGMVVTATYEDSTTADVTKKCSFDVDMSTAGEKTVTVNHRGKTAQFTIKVNKTGLAAIPMWVFIVAGIVIVGVIIIGISVGVLKVNKKGKVKVNKSGVKKVNKGKKKNN